MIKQAVEHCAKVHQVFLYEFHWVPHHIALKAKRLANIVFDHMEGYYGISSLEGLSMGKPVIAGLNDYCVDAIVKFFNLKGDASIPWQRPLTQSVLNNALIDLVGNQQFRTITGKKSREFMENTWNDKYLAQRLIDVYERA